MPIDIKEFESRGEVPKREFIHENIMRILRANPDKAFSSIELENALGVRRQGINQALRALETQGKVKRGFVEVNKRLVCFVKLMERKEQDKNENEVASLAQPEEIPKEKKPRKGKSKKDGTPRKGGKSGKKRS